MSLYIVGFGAGNEDGMTLAAKKAIEKSDLVVGYTVYTELMKKIFPDKEYFHTPMTQERERCQKAVETAAKGKNVSIICSGDSGVYGMASLALEIAADYPGLKTEVIPGVTSALSAGAIAGAPLGHDFAVISLSDLLTPWEKIEKRLECAAEGDFAIAIYNPSSKKRHDYLKKACDILLRYKSGDTVCAAAKNVGREGESYSVMTLMELRDYEADMFTTVFVGSSQTKNINGKMVTPRGYKNV